MSGYPTDDYAKGVMYHLDMLEMYNVQNPEWFDQVRDLWQTKLEAEIKREQTRRDMEAQGIQMGFAPTPTAEQAINKALEYLDEERK